ncbi:NAD-binding protein [Escherichia coli]
MSTVKIIHQLLAGVHIAAGAEAMALAARAGIPLDVMYDVVTNAAGNSWMFENRMRHVVDGDYTPHSAVDIFVKDLVWLPIQPKRCTSRCHWPQQH